jgi:hypothetical protein
MVSYDLREMQRLCAQLSGFGLVGRWHCHMSCPRLPGQTLAFAGAGS